MTPPCPPNPTRPITRPITEPIALRPLEPGDAATIEHLFNDSGVYRYMAAAMPVPYTQQDALDFIQACREGKRLEWGITVDGQLAGCIGSTLPERDEKGIPTALTGYWIGRAFWHRGVMTRALHLFLQAVAEHLPEDGRVQAKVFAPHIVSQRILLHAGFTQEPGFELKPMRDGLPHVTFVYNLPASQLREATFGKEAP